MHGQKLSLLSGPNAKALLAAQSSAPTPCSFVYSFLKFCVASSATKHTGPDRRAQADTGPGAPAPRAPGARPHRPRPPAPPCPAGPASRLLLSSPPHPPEQTSGGGGPRTGFPQTRGRVEEEAAEPRVPLRRRRAPPASAHQPRRLLGLAEPRGGKGGGGCVEAAGCGRRRRGRPRLPLCCAARAEEGEVGGGGSSASRSLRGSWRRRSAHPGPSGRGGRGAGCSGPSPGRCGDCAAPRRRPRPARRLRAPRRGRSPAAAAPAAGDMSNPGGRRNGPVKLRLTGEGVGRAAGAGLGHRWGEQAGGGCLWP